MDEDVKKQKLIQKPNLVASASLSISQGPLPHPSILEKYNEILPGAAERILAMAEQQSRHRQDIERQRLEVQQVIVRGGLRNDLVRQVMAAIVVLLALGGGIAIALIKQSLGAYVVLVTEVAFLASAVAFRSHRESAEKRREVSIPKR